MATRAMHLFAVNQLLWPVSIDFTCKATCSHESSLIPSTPFSVIISLEDEIQPKDPCYPTPCGPNTQCSNGHCSCLSDYIGNPLAGCRPECLLNSECPRDRSCVRSKCVDPCIGTCSPTATCSVLNHIAICSCPPGYTGNAHIACVPKIETVPARDEDQCVPSPCGPNSQCFSQQNQAICSCLPGYFGSPPSCRPECVSVSDCPLPLTCVNQKCIDPCPGTCGFNADCRVVNHNAVCVCPRYYTGDPFTRCSPIAIGKTRKCRLHHIQRNT